MAHKAELHKKIDQRELQQVLADMDRAAHSPELRESLIVPHAAGQPPHKMREKFEGDVP